MNAMLPFPDLSPEIFSFTLFGMTVALRWYALAYIVGILVGWRIVVRAVERPKLWAGNTTSAIPRRSCGSGRGACRSTAARLG